MTERACVHLHCDRPSRARKVCTRHYKQLLAIGYHRVKAVTTAQPRVARTHKVPPATHLQRPAAWGEDCWTVMDRWVS